MQTREKNKLAFLSPEKEYMLRLLNEESNYPEEVRDSTSGSLGWFGEYQTPTSVGEHNLEQKINEKYNLLIEYFKQELDSLKSRLEQSQKVVKVQGKDLNVIKKEMNLQKLDRIAAYGNNWNGEGTIKFDEEMLTKTRFILFSTSLHRQPKIFPTNRNTIQLEYEDTNNRYLEVEVLPDKFHILTDLTGEENEYEVHSVDEIIAVMNEF